jgi:hypothetical protein
MGQFSHKSAIPWTYSFGSYQHNIHSQAANPSDSSNNTQWSHKPGKHHALLCLPVFLIDTVNCKLLSPFWRFARLQPAPSICLARRAAFAAFCPSASQVHHVTGAYSDKEQHHKAWRWQQEPFQQQQ